MTDAQRVLLKGAIKSAIGSATGLVIALPNIDPLKFNITSLGGWGHLGSAIVVTVVIAECRFWNQWSASGDKA